MLLNVDQLQKQLDKDEFQENVSMTAFWVVNNQFQKFIDSKFTLDYDSQMTDTYTVNGFAEGTKASDNAASARKEMNPVKDYILLTIMATDPIFSDPKSSHDDGSKPSSDDEKKVDEYPRKESKCNDQEKEDNVNNTNNVNAAGINEVNVVGGKTSIELPFDPNIYCFWKMISIFDFLKRCCR
ncbi:hypothetical protein Tco_1040867 [Tanacetum coccineum]|uniref:Uncharacterized protein n=1 Tax=Tanacetum coccineum TaxID=301880 RepID=A0ABQ5GGR4_9ASTR